MKFIVYDFDGTIYDGDSTFDFIKFLISKKKSILLYIPKMFLYLIKYKLKLIKKETMKECFFEIFNKFNNIDELVEEFWNSNEKNIKNFFKNKKTHKNDIIASASPYFLLEPIAKKYNEAKVECELALNLAEKQYYDILNITTSDELNTLVTNLITARLNSNSIFFICYRIIC